MTEATQLYDQDAQETTFDEVLPTPAELLGGARLLTVTALNHLSAPLDDEALGKTEEALLEAATAVQQLRRSLEARDEPSAPEGTPPADGEPVVPPPEQVDDPEDNEPTVPAPDYGDPAED